jgi:hypothetical protein
MAVDMAKRKLTFKERLNLELMLRIGAGGIHAAADIQGILDADRRVNPATKQPASGRVRFAVAGLNADRRQATVATVKYFLKNHGMPTVSPSAIKRVLREKRQSEEKAQVVQAGDETVTGPEAERAALIKKARELIAEAERPVLPAAVIHPRGVKLKLAHQALAELYGGEIPDPLTLGTKDLLRAVIRWLKDKNHPLIGNDTILKAAGRRK